MNGQHMLNIAEAGLGLSNNLPDQQSYLLIVLLDLEDALDKGRALIHDADMTNEVAKKMDELRKRIRGLIDGMDKDEVKQLLAFRGEDLKQQFYV